MSDGDLAAHGIALVRADNPSPLTLSGTNTWVVGRWVVDPGPALDAHLDAVAAEVAARGGAEGIALTHDHADHAEGLDGLLSRVGDVPVVSARAGAADGDVFGPLLALALPGHSDDHLAFVAGRAGFTGDAVLGDGSVFVSSDLAGYLDGLRRMRELDLDVLCPGHGPPVWDVEAKLDEYLEHRLDRERRLLEALEQGLPSEDELLDVAWSDAPAELRPAPRCRCARTWRSCGRRAGRTAAVSRTRSLAGASGRRLVHPSAGDLVGRRQRGDARGVRVVEHGADSVVDRADAELGSLGVVALGLELDGDVDDAAGVCDEVGYPQDPARGQQLSDGLVGELIVRGAGDRAGAEHRHERLIEHAAERARREHVDVGGQRGSRIGPLGGNRSARPRRRSSMSASTSSAPPSASSSASRPPTLPTPTTATRRPSSEVLPNTRSQPTRIAASTPSAVHGLGSPEPPRSVEAR